MNDKPLLSSEFIEPHLVAIPELDFSSDLTQVPYQGPWFRLGSWTLKSERNDFDIQDVISRQSLLISKTGFQILFDRLDSIGNVIGNLGKPGGSVLQEVGQEGQYSYHPFYKFDFSFTPESGEPLCFLQQVRGGVRFYVNPDILLYFELEETSPGSSIWKDPRNGDDILVQKRMEADNLLVVDIRTSYLRKYLQARQLPLLVGHYRHLHLYDPPQEKIDQYVEGEMVLGSKSGRVKAFLQNWGLRKEVLGESSFLQRRLHLWFQVIPDEINVESPWDDPPDFDLGEFTFMTSSGPVAPGRWRSHSLTKDIVFQGTTCDFMDRIYFRQEVLIKYETSSGFKVDDDGSVHCQHYWGLDRSTNRHGNELISTSIGDFAEGVPFEEWLHWKQYAADQPDDIYFSRVLEEKSVVRSINELATVLIQFNNAFINLANSLRIYLTDALWVGSLDSIAGRQLKWVYPSKASEDEFIKRATLLSTLIVEEIKPGVLRNLLEKISEGLSMDHSSPPRALGSRNMLQRLVLVLSIILKLRAKPDTILSYVKQAEGQFSSQGDAELDSELKSEYKRIRKSFEPMAFLYELRNFGGLAHSPNKQKFKSAVVQLGLPSQNWQRQEFLTLAELVKNGIKQIICEMDAINS